MYHTVWTLHKTKTARLVVTLYRHITDKLPTSYRHITNCRPTDSLYFGENLSAVCWPSATGHSIFYPHPPYGRHNSDRPFPSNSDSDTPFFFIKLESDTPWKIGTKIPFPEIEQLTLFTIFPSFFAGTTHQSPLSTMSIESTSSPVLSRCCS